MNKPMTLPYNEYRDKFSEVGRAPPHCTDGSVMGRGTDAESAGRLRRRALAQYSGLVFPVLDGLRAGRNCAGTRGPRNFQGLGTARGATRPLRRHAGDCLCGHLRNVADMAVMRKTHG
jgi:hypothetical protein